MSKFTNAIRTLAKMKALDAENAERLLNAHVEEQDGGSGSGNFGHKGRPGKRGGSSPGKGGGSASSGVSGKSGSAPMGFTKGKTPPLMKKAESPKGLGFEDIIKAPPAISVKKPKPIGQLWREENKSRTLPNGMVEVTHNGKTYTYNPKKIKEFFNSIGRSETKEQNPSNPESRANSGVIGIEGSEGSTGGSKGAVQKKKEIEDQFKSARAFLRNEMKNFHRGSEDMKSFHEALENMKKPLDSRPSPEESKALSKKFASNISKQMDDYTKQKYLKAIEDEPKITSCLCDIAEAEGFGFFGLRNRLKSGGENHKGECRLMVKQRDYLREAEEANEPITPKEATDKIKDMVRYTMCVSQNTMGDDADKVLGELEKRKYTIIKIGDTWKKQRGDNPYRGLNCAVVSPEGTVFELQFHSPESYATKDACHGRYEIARSTKYSKPKRIQSNGFMRHYYNALKMPSGLEKLKPRLAKLKR